MQHTAFEKIIVIGYGKIAGDILEYIINRQKEYGFSVAFIEHEVHTFGVTEKICRENGVPFTRIEEKQKLAAHLCAEPEKTLIVSASNNFLFPKALVEKENITIINFHNALLPDYPGRNAPSWVIFAGEKESGITWHYVTAGIDAGNIIIQKRCEIGADTKAFELAGKLMELAFEAFAECFDDVVREQARTKVQHFGTGRRMYRSYEVPADGFFELTEEPAYIYRLLRSMDYGKNGIFPPAQTEIRGKRAEILRYRKTAGEAALLAERTKREEERGNEIAEKEAGSVENAVSVSENENTEGFVYLPLAENRVLKIKYRML